MTTVRPPSAERLPGRAAVRATSRPRTAFGYRTELIRQAGRMRTRLALGVMVALPLIILVAFQFAGGGNPESGPQSQLTDLSGMATLGGANFTVFVMFVSGWLLLAIVVATFCGDTVAAEASNGTLRYLLAVPVPRGRLLAVKLLVALTYSAAALLLLVGTALLAGSLRYGWRPLYSSLSGEVPAGEAVLRILAATAFLGTTMLSVAAIAFLLSVYTDAPLNAAGGAVLVYVLSTILEQIPALGPVRAFLPAHFGDAWFGLMSTPMYTDDVARGSALALGYAVVCLTLAWRHFLRKDVVT